MSQVQTLTPTYIPPTRPQVRTRQPVRPAAPPSLFRCLIVSASEKRLAMLRQAAEEQGWDPILCESAPEASREAIRNRVLMAVVDLDTAGHGPPDGFEELAERLAGESGRLLLVCGNEDDALEEIWARQLGAWMYLPGVDDRSDVAMVVGEAKNVAEKLLGPADQFTATI